LQRTYGIGKLIIKIREQLKLVCTAKEERTFNIRLEKLKQMMNPEAKEWLEEQMVNKHKWANAFDEGGCRYGVNNTNLPEVINKVLKGIRAMPVSAIVEYTFYKINSHFVHRWKKAKDHIDRGLRGVNIFGKAAEKHLTEQGLKAASMRAELFDPTLYVYSVRTASALNVGGEMMGGRIYKVDLSRVTCTCCIPQLLHVPCSHMIAACTVRGVSWLAPAYTTQLYSKESILKTWAARFEPILDKTHWPEYNGPDYVPDDEKRKLGVGRRKKKRLHNEIDQTSGYDRDIYGAEEFDKEKSKNRCSVCHEEGQQKERHKQSSGSGYTVAT
jgi:hypothetical protein